MNERTERICNMLERRGIQSLVCSHPVNVLMTTGYWPVVGNSLSVVTGAGRVGLLVPEDEKRLTGATFADEVRSFKAASLDNLDPVVDIVPRPLGELAVTLGAGSGPVGHDAGHCSEPSTYAAGFIYGASLLGILEQAVNGAHLIDVSHSLALLRGALTSSELENVRAACRIAVAAFRDAVGKLRTGTSERQIADALHGCIVAESEEPRSGAYTFCMSGPNSANAYAAYQLPTPRKIQRGDVALVHCNSYFKGFWTDVTRTYSFGKPDQKKNAVYNAVLDASDAALEAVRPGVCASEVDAAAREVLTKAGFGKEFKHPAGHGAGIRGNRSQRISAHSPEVGRCAGTRNGVQPRTSGLLRG